MSQILKKAELLLSKGFLKLIRTVDNEEMVVTRGEISPLLQSGRLLRKTFYDTFKIFLNGKQLQTLIEFLEIHPLTDDTVYESACRIYNGKDCLAYELNKDTEECIVITPEEINISNVPNVYFKHAADFENQVEPSWDVEPKDIFSYIHHHFNLKNEKQEKLLVLYLVTAFFGLQISHSLLILTGEKGSSKSTTMRKLEKLIDPKRSDLCGIPKGTDGLELRLANTYFVCLDNLSSINRNISDTIARAVTGGSVTKRALYHNTKEVVLKPMSKDKWRKHLVCECGSTYKKYRWRVNKKSGEEVNGYQCRNQVRNRKKSFRIENGLDATGFCDVPSICEWKLDYMAKVIFQRLWENQNNSIMEIVGNIEENYVEEKEEHSERYEAEKLQRELERLQKRKNNLVDMRLDELIDEVQYQKKYNLITGRMEEVEISLQKIQADGKEIEPVDISKEIERMFHRVLSTIARASTCFRQTLRCRALK